MATQHNNTAQLIQTLGETDQLFLQQNTPELALQRGKIRLALIQASQHQQEQVYFLQQAIVIVEQARIEFEEMPLSLYLDLSILLGQIYMCYFNLTQQARFALITEQILRPLAHHHHFEIYQLLKNAAIAQQHSAMATYWQKKIDSLFQPIPQTFS